jgi:hypothetical protein
MNNSLHGSNSSTDGTEDAFINDHPDGMENYVEDILFPMLDEGSLDHAILESLFYNEISMMNSSNSNMNEINEQSDIPSSSTYDVDAFMIPPVNSASDNSEKIHEHSYLPHQQHATSTTDTCIDIGPPSNIPQNGNVTLSNFDEHDTRVNFLHSYQTDTSNVTHVASVDGITPSRRYAPAHGVGSSFGNSSSTIQPLLQHQTSSLRKLSVQLPKHALVTGGGIRHNVVPVLDKNDTERTQLPPSTTTPSTTADSTDKNPTNPTSPTAEEKKRKKLISQFATLAGRLGITLPPQVFQKLTGQVAADANPGEVTTTMAPVPDPIPMASLSTALSPADTKPAVIETRMEVVDEPQQQPIVPSAPPPVLLQQAQKSAVEAIAAVSNKRSNTIAGISTTSDNAVDSPMESSKPYSKKRKKPRLSDCEQKLAELQSENMILKRHLDNIANRNARLDEDRMKAEKQMRQMLHDNAPDSILDPVVKNFTDMYSDYGRKRHDELNFHLQQLQRYVSMNGF